MPMKPIKRGLKIFAACCSVTGYVWSILPYTGKLENYPSDSVGGLGGHVTNTLLADLTHTWRHVYADNFFVTVPLCELLLQKNTYMTGTTRPNRIGFPVEARVLGRDPRGTVRVYRSDSGVTAAGIVDKRPFHMLSTCHSGVELITRERMQHDGTSSADQLLRLQDDYNHRMGGVDYADARIGSYQSQRKVIGHWYLHYIFWMIETAALNAYCIWSGARKEHIEKGRKTPPGDGTFLSFKIQLIKEIYNKKRGPAGDESKAPKRSRKGKERGTDDRTEEDHQQHEADDAGASEDLRTPVKNPPKRLRGAQGSDEAPIHKKAASEVYVDFDARGLHTIWNAKDLPGRENKSIRGKCDECKNNDAKCTTMCAECYVFLHIGACAADHTWRCTKDATLKKRRESNRQSLTGL